MLYKMGEEQFKNFKYTLGKKMSELKTEEEKEAKRYLSKLSREKFKANHTEKLKLYQRVYTLNYYHTVLKKKKNTIATL
jgi:hypothetical protein